MAQTVTINVIPNTGPNPLTAYCSSQVTGGAAPYTYDWSFGDGTPDATTPNVVHAFPAGTFNVVLTVTDSNGVEVQASAPVVVSAAILPATFTPTPSQACVATNPGPLLQMAAPIAQQQIPSGASLEQVDAGSYYDRCLGEYISTSGIPIGVTVASVSNADGTMNIGPTTGNVIVSLNTAHANKWSAVQTFSQGANLGQAGSVDQVGNASFLTLSITASDIIWSGTAAPVLNYNGGQFKWFDSNALAFPMILYTSAQTIAAGYTLSVAAVSNSSDSRLKDFAGYAGDPLAELAAVRFGQYSRMAGARMEGWRAGIAAESLPSTVSLRQQDGYFAIRQPDGFAWLVGCLKAQQAEILELQARLARLTGAS